MEKNWYVATVRSCQERKVVERLTARGIQAYVPVQKVPRKWSDRIKLIDKLLIPGMVFIRCDESTRRSIFDWLYGVTFFLMDHGKEIRTPLVIPDRQMEDFMNVVRAFDGGSELTVNQQEIERGDTVRVLCGPLAGFVCECVKIQNQHKIIIRLGQLGSLLASISVSDVVKI